MKKLLLISFMLLLSACGNGDRYNFSGSTESWDVFYTVNITGADEQNASGTINYVGEDGPPENITYLIDAKTGKVEDSNVSLEDGSVQVKGHSCSGCAIVQENQNIEITIIWDDNQETITLN